MKKFYLVLLALVGLTSCGIFNDTVFDGMALTTSDQLVRPVDPMVDDVFFIPESMVPVQVLMDPRFAGKQFVVADKSLIKLDAPQVDFTTNENGNWFTNTLGIVFGVASAWFPKLAAFEGLLILLSRRKRQHYTEAVKAALPYDGEVDIKGAVVSVGRALGIAHTSAATREVAEMEKKGQTVTLHG